MQNKIRSNELAYLIGLQERIIRQEVETEENLIEGDDYFFAGSALYLYSTSVTFLLGQFGLVDISKFREVNETLEKLYQKPKGTFSTNDPNLPALSTTEQNWNDKIIPIIHGNAEAMHMSYPQFLALVYSTMNVNFSKYAGMYLDKVGMPEAKVSKLRVITVTKELRILFEQTMSSIMARR